VQVVLLVPAKAHIRAFFVAQKGGEVVANEVGNLVVKVGMDTMGFQEGMTTLNRQLRLARSEVGLASSQLRNFGTSTDG